VQATFTSLLSLASSSNGPSPADIQLASAMHPLLCSVFVESQRLSASDVSLPDVVTLLANEARSDLSVGSAVTRTHHQAANGFCVMAPAASAEERLVRGTGIYLAASRVNHSCFPNVARFDYFDAPGSDNMLLHLRARLLAFCRPPLSHVPPQAIDPIPAGSELLMSYFQVTLPRAQRQERLLRDYGFRCACPRCELEAAAALQSSGDAMDAESGEENWERGGDGYSAEYALWFLKNVCPREGCGGTLAPPSEVADCMECNRCAYLRSDAEFYALLEEV
jgi:SET and MYND domain-containing protein